LRTAYKDAPRLAQALLQAAAIAEQIQKRMPGQGIELVSPYMATEVRTGASVDGKSVGLVFQTTEGVPIQVTILHGYPRSWISLNAAHPKSFREFWLHTLGSENPAHWPGFFVSDSFGGAGGFFLLPIGWCGVGGVFNIRRSTSSRFSLTFCINAGAVLSPFIVH
jgi:hypothetical protein